MTSNNTKTFILFLALILSVSTLFASSSDSLSASGENSISARVLIGRSSLNYNVGYGFQYQHARSLFTIRFIKGVENDWHTAKSLGLDLNVSRPLEVTYEYSALYGTHVKVPHGQLSMSLGMGLMHFKVRGAHLRWGFISFSDDHAEQIDERETLYYNLFNVPYEIEYTIMPNPFGIALSVFGNANTRVFMIGFAVSALFGTSFNTE